MSNENRVAAGVDVGAECVKAVIVNGSGVVVGRSVVPTRGYFQACVHEVLAVALDDAQVAETDLAGICATGFAASCVPQATMTATETACHALGAYQHHAGAMTVINIGGRDPRVIRVNDAGRRIEALAVRRCAVGIGTFLMFTARHLDVHPTRLQELAAAAERPAAISSFCSVFSSTEILERLREGASREEVALGCMHSIAERIVEIGGFEQPLVVTGGVAEYFPGVIRALESQSGTPVAVVPQPLFAGALGAAMKALGEPAAV
ncbi:MAG: acyl-CoA dehydratase activase [Bacteroidales bacterium]